MAAQTRIIYAGIILPTDDPVRRIARARQSEEAARLVTILCGSEFVPEVQSRSHSRAAIAAAVCRSREVSLGIDIEWMSPDRPMEAIARGFLSTAPAELTLPDFYRGWTFYEAYFKAFQRAPDEALLIEAVRAAKDDIEFRLADGTQCIQHCVATIFRLCLVWRGPGSIAIERRQAQ